MDRHSDQTKQGHNIKFPTKWWKNSWLIIFGFLGLLVVVILAVVFLYNPKTQAEIRHDRIEEVNSLLGLEEYDQALVVVEESIDQKPLDDELVELYMLKAVILNSQGNRDEALEIALEADAIESSYRTVSFIVNLALEDGDNELLLQYLPRQIELLDPLDESYDAIKLELETLLGEIET